MEETNSNEAGAEANQSAIRNPQSLVLTVEDSAIQSKLLERILLEAGYRVAVAKDGAEGLVMAQQEKPALIISDINMPGMNGFELCLAIKKDETLRHVPVILLTMLTDTRDVIRALSVGADSYINKPYDAERLLYRIRFVMEHPVPPPPPVERRKMVVDLDGETIQVTASSCQQILNLLVYTYDNAVVQNTDLITTQDALQKLNEHLEEAVNEKTAELSRTLNCLQESEEKFRQISATAQDAILMMDSAGRIVFWNRAAEKMFGYTAEETLGQELHALIVPERFRAAFAEKFPAFAATGAGAIIGKTLELAAFGKNGTEFPVELSVSAAQLGGQWHAIGFIRDISERKRAEQALRESENLYRSLFENMLNGFAYCQMIFEQDQPQDFIYLSVNTAFETSTGLRNVVGKRVSEVIPGIRQSDPGLFDIYGRVSLTGKPEQFEIYVEALQQWFWISVYSPEKGYFVAVFDVITERKQAEALLHESAELNRQLFESSRDALTTVAPPSWKFTRANRAALELFGAKSETELMARGPLDMSPERQPDGLLSGEKAQEHIAKAMREGSNFFEWEHTRFNGEPFTADVLLTRMETGKEVFLQATTRDITERKRNKQALLKLNRAFRTLSAGNHELVHATDEAQLLQGICRVIVEGGGYHAAWVGYKQDDAEQSVRPMARSGFEAGYADALQITWADRERGQGPSGKAVRSGTTQVVQDVANDPDCAPWREQVTQHNNTSGNASVIALPLHDNGEVLGCLTIYAAQANAFDPEEIALLEEMAGDLAFGIRMLRLRQEQQRSTEQVREGLEGTIQAIAGMVEMRDPYTAGHQQRVAQLAAAIAVEMGLSEERVHGIHLAGTIHDLGKIQTPAEILSKPGKLSAIEYDLIKEHAQNGYDILKDIEFPWPVAQMAWQHHERMDGSGYPQGLKGDEILLEARIIAVADVVEAMSSHRPYRPGLGIDVALEEIIKGRDVHYDPDAVDECIWLFRDKGFEFG